MTDQDRAELVEIIVNTLPQDFKATVEDWELIKGRIGRYILNALTKAGHQSV